MVSLLKNRFSLYTLTTALLFSTHNVDVFAHNAKSQVLSEAQKVSCDQNAAFYQCSDGAEHTISNKDYSLTYKNINGDHGAIEASKAKTAISGQNITVKSTLDEKENLEKNFWKHGVKVSEKAGVSLTASTLQGVLVGVEAQGGFIKMSGGSIDALKVGALAEEKTQSTVYLTNTQVSFGEVGVKAGEKGYVILEGVSLSDKGGNGKAGQGLDTAHQSDHAAFHISKDGYVQFMKGSVEVADAHGLLLQGNQGSQISIEDSQITVKGNAFYGMRFEGEAVSDNSSNEKLSRVDLKKTHFIVPDSIALYSSKSKKSNILLKEAKLFGDLLLKADNNSSMKIVADASALGGQTQVDNSSTVELILKNNSQWALLQPRHKNLQDPNYRGVSFISSVSLSDSSIAFEKPKSSTAYAYQTLYIGEGKGIVYQAFRNAWVHLNAHLNPNETSNNQVTDRLLIHGDVKGKTIVNIQGIAGGLKEKNNKAHSVSIIQVYGNASHDSFQLNGQYVALNGTPYKYVLRSYSPNATGENEHVKQKFVQNGGEFWNFRLENEYVQTSADYSHTSTVSERTSPAHVSIVDVIPASSGDIVSESSTDAVPTFSLYAVPTFSVNAIPVSSADAIPVSSADAIPVSSADVVPVSSEDALSDIEDVLSFEQGVRSVVPQVPTYLLLPNSLFHAGLMDISNQNKQLEILRANSSGVLEIREKPASFLRGYGGSYHYASDLSALEYGYGGDLGYYAVEAGILLQKVENVDSAVSFGIMGSYGKLSLQPLDVEQSQKSTFDKWTATIYGSLQHDVGFYVDGLLSYGLFKGDVLTLARGKVVALKGKQFSGSFTSGKTFAIGYKGVVFDPQVQVVYQYLQFNKARDIDNFDIEMDKLGQWMVRIGGRLMKTLSASEMDRDVSFYGKIHFAHDFGKERSVRFKDSFQLGNFGSSLEAGLGLNAHLSQHFTLHGDLMYQHKLSKGGFSGISFSGGLRYRF
ncbi:autotransporter outer membrane beta-barrel domain-containing protein [Bartonella rattimassiliensis]|uniref:Outer membrane autotransporter barrel domain-containing protein n=1 Tax=Bartonella rattimassiliensis 15908 TaxID=1094556 RepID=J0ZAU7_9HYPH|nr:autotransporter outer membrane beta-barrel domain-containing protein [Bartonella rattimassiliensis]EJF84953.1 outer membrane autotransporter barrel domain-containing protein [Bartonella rattimassiliensis 15908]